MAPAPPGLEAAPVVGSSFSIRSLLASRDDKGCEDGTKAANLCEKPVGNSMTIPIVVGVIVPLVIAVSLVYYFHRKGMKRRAREEASDPNQDLDFGLDGPPGAASGGKRKSMFREKMMNIDPRHRAQISMDMNLQSPYLLPPALQGSKESLHSLARNINGNEDPYRPVHQQYGSEVGSIRSFRPDKETMGGSSIYTKSTERRDTATSRDLPPRGNSLSHRQIPTSPVEHLPMPPPPVADPFGTPRSGSMTPRSDMDMASPISPRGVVPEIGSIEFPQANYHELDRDANDLPAGNQNIAQGMARSSWGEPGMAVSDRPLPGQAQTTDDRHESLALPELGVGLGLDNMQFQDTSANARSVPTLGLPSSPRPPPQAQNSPLPTIISEDTQTHDAHEATYHEDVYEERGRSALRRSMDGNYRDSQVLGVPQQDNKRLSVGQRPLPPDEVMEFEDPEERANRIRSFYKEYFDDSVRPDQQQQRGPPQGGGVAYYEDYDAGYSGNNRNNNNNNDGAYYDPRSNAFVMPYAQPVTRRAMTPPPGASRQRGPPNNRPRNGSMGGMSMPGGRRPPPPRTGSAMSSNWGQPRPGSSVSNRSARQPPKPRGPPPAALTTLPTPSKLKDDSFALLGAIDFAPPETYEDRTRGRSQSPIGERRPYKPKVPVASPLISSYDEMGAIPSPHLLRKSSTFTGLDFAPPRRFGNGDDNMSDAGSIRSNKSGISAAQAHAIRSGAGRVSRLPEDTVFTTAKLEQTLKPSWSMRDL
ncbi:hypothetical protein F5X68DRAFT_78937 [Plectosphaerella plurivora]|uniref:Uncharacterized protein n=1 Tax=Plectosphaerella plurivora TaxID=936078 RepID=A0A9P9A951_9PEZI|nr:hypothetical protein F5X68DRAFT_78937 [Plectosphaerella plurivora]